MARILGDKADVARARFESRSVTSINDGIVADSHHLAGHGKKAGERAHALVADEVCRRDAGERRQALKDARFLWKCMQCRHVFVDGAQEAKCRDSGHELKRIDKQASGERWRRRLREHRERTSVK